MCPSARCNLCGGDCSSKGSYIVLGKYEANVAQCNTCGFLFVIEPTWLSEAYSSPMTRADIGHLDRCLERSRIAKILIELFHNRHLPSLDFGAGYGLFVRRMRDLGYQFFWYDNQCPNLFAKGFEMELAGAQRFEMITAFEVVEHLVNPGPVLERILLSSKSFLFSTELLPQPLPQFAEWPYFGPEHGQHISFYTSKAFSTLAARTGKRFITNGFDLHLITERKVTGGLFNILTNQWIAKLLSGFRKRETLMYSDFEKLRERAIKEVEHE